MFEFKVEILIYHIFFQSGVWEGSSWSGKDTFTPKTVILANVNATPDEMRLDSAVKSKV